MYKRVYQGQTRNNYVPRIAGVRKWPSNFRKHVESLNHWAIWKLDHYAKSLHTFSNNFFNVSVVSIHSVGKCKIEWCKWVK